MRIDHPAQTQIPALRRLWKEAFADPDAYLDLFFDRGYASHKAMCVTDGERVVAALYWLDMEYCGGKIAYIYAVATAKAYRGRGLCRKLMAETHRVLQAKGYAAAVLVPQDSGLARMYAAMGYLPGSGIRQMRCEAAEAAAPLKQVDSQTYHRLRKETLPSDGIALGVEAQLLLAAQAEFYTGDGVLLAAVREGTKVNGLELLGDESAAPEIVAALGCREGVFRMPGEDPFAMYIPLTEGVAAPGHLGFAFD